MEENLQRICKLIRYGFLAEDLASDLWIVRLIKANKTAFKARVWMTIVNRLVNAESDDFDLTLYYPKISEIMQNLENEVVGAYIAMADGNEVQLVARSVAFGVHCSVLARALLDIEVAEKLRRCVTPDEYTLILNKYLERLHMDGLPKIVSDCLEKIRGDCFYDFKERAYIFSGAMLEGEEALKKAKKDFKATGILQEKAILPVCRLASKIDIDYRGEQ